MLKSPVMLSFNVNDDEGEYVGLCNDFPSLSFCAPTVWKALRGIKQLVWEIVSSNDAEFGHFYAAEF